MVLAFAGDSTITRFFVMLFRDFHRKISRIKLYKSYFRDFFYICVMNNLVLTAVNAARAAGQAIMEVYRQPFEVYTKDDDSPVTQADLRASTIIKEMLRPTGLPFVSEEDLPTDRSGFGRYWLVDPLDGTAEFVKRNGEFTVNIALIENKKPVLGVIYAPVTGRLWKTGDRRQETGDRRQRATVKLGGFMALSPPFCCSVPSVSP